MFSGMFNTNAQHKHLCHSERNGVESKNLGRSPYCIALKPISSLRRRARSFDFGLRPTLRMTSANFAETGICALIGLVALQLWEKICLRIAKGNGKIRHIKFPLLMTDFSRDADKFCSSRRRFAFAILNFFGMCTNTHYISIYHSSEGFRGLVPWQGF